MTPRPDSSGLAREKVMCRREGSYRLVCAPPLARWIWHYRQSSCVVCVIHLQQCIDDDATIAQNTPCQVYRRWRWWHSYRTKMHAVGSKLPTSTPVWSDARAAICAPGACEHGPPNFTSSTALGPSSIPLGTRPQLPASACSSTAVETLTMPPFADRGLSPSP